MHRTALLGAVVPLALAAAPAVADIVQVRITVENLAGPNGVALSPVTLAAHDGSYDAFDAGLASGLATRLIAEGGNGSSFISDAHAASPGAVTAAVVATSNGFGPGIFLPGGSGSVVLTLDTTTNRFLSYGAMVVPSNDFFIGNDDPMAIRLFDDAGNFVAQDFTLTGSRVWDAGTEVNQLFGAAFLAASNGGDHADQNGLVTLGADFSTYAGQLTPAGYLFSNLPTAGSAIARFSFEVVPAPGASVLLALGGLLAGRRRR